MMGPGDKEKCGTCKKMVRYEEIWSFTAGKPFCSVKCYMKHLKIEEPDRYRQLSVVLGEF